MMKKAIYIIVIISFVACNRNQEKDVAESDNTDFVKSDSISIDEIKFDLNGTWGLTNYFDSIIENKELAKFRIQTPTWFAILLEIENDSLKSFGSINKDLYLIEKTNDTLTTLISNVSGDKWYLIAKDSELKLIQYPNSGRIDSSVYIYRKRDDLNYFTTENKDFFIIGNNVTEYFNEQLFVGEYINKKTNQVVVFDHGGKLTGIDGFDSYKVRNYFGTLHPHKNLDVITFSNSKTDEYKQYNWIFSDDELFLTEFVYEKVTFNGETHDGDDMILGKEKIKLKITRH